MEWLANVAWEKGICVFKAEVLAENRQMMEVFKEYGFNFTSKLGAGVEEVSIPIARTGRVLRKEEERERISTLNALRYIMSPRSVAVVGASRNKGTLGQLVFQAILQSGFSGVVYPVNPNADSVMSVKAYPSILTVPGNIDLAISIVRAELVAGVADECGRKGVRALIVISDGFKERGKEGAARER
jgi:predicted CoA-binding protein